MSRVVWMAFGLSILLAAPVAVAEDGDEGADDESSVEISAVGEFGFNAPLYHRIQFSQDGTYFDYVDEGGQDVLFPFSRLSTEVDLGDRHTVGFLYQPLTLDTRARLGRDVVVDEATFEAGTPVDLLYNFPFYRATYLYDLVGADRTDVEIGGSLQIRNATISFESADGTLRRENRDVGLVPLFQFRGRHQLDSDWWFGTEIGGFYAPIQYLNLSDEDVLGAIWDASIRAGYSTSERADLFLNLRYLGGGARGTSQSDAEEGPGDGFVENWLNLLTVSVGIDYEIR